MQRDTILAILFGLDGKHILLHLDTLGVKIDSEGDVTGIRVDEDVVSMYTSDNTQIYFELSDLTISFLEDDDTNTTEYIINNNHGVIVEMEGLDVPL